MRIDLCYRQEPDHLVVAAAGPWTADTAARAIDAIRAEAAARGAARLLLDLTALAAPDGELTRFLTGEYWAKAVGAAVRAAVVMRPGTFSGFGEDAAVNRGARLKVFADPAAAAAWLRAAADSR